MDTTKLAAIPGLAADIVVEVAEDQSVHPANRRARCIDCGQVVKANDSDDRFWPWLAADGTTRCAAQGNKWGHRVPVALSAWLDGEDA